jgi:hypothetical protein
MESFLFQYGFGAAFRGKSKERTAQNSEKSTSIWGGESFMDGIIEK